MYSMDKIKLATFSLACTSFLISTAASAMIPPWYLLQTKMSKTLENDPCVKVNKLTGSGKDMHIIVDACNYEKAVALASILEKSHTFGSNNMVHVEVRANNQFVHMQSPRTIDDFISTLTKGLTGNQQFVKIDKNRDNTLFLEFKPVVIQYSSGNISDYYGMSNVIAADAFYEVLNIHQINQSELHVNTTTSPIN